MADGDNLPRDAKAIKRLLSSMGVDNYEPRVVRQFQEIWYRFVVDVLMDAQLYSNHAGKACIDSADVKLAIQSNVNFRRSQSLSPQLLLAAQKRNKLPIPRPPTDIGMSLPPEQDTVITSKFLLEIQKSLSSEAIEEQREEQDATEFTPKPSQEPRTGMLPNTHQRVSFHLRPKRPKRSF